MPKLSLGRAQALAPGNAVWQVTEVVEVVDGDTVKVLRQTEHILSDWLISTVRDRKPVTLRLARLDTPEMHGKTGAERDEAQKAKDQLAAWIVANLKHGFTVEVLGDGGFSRILADLRAMSSPPASASDYMRSMGWPDYVKGA